MLWRYFLFWIKHTVLRGNRSVTRSTQWSALQPLGMSWSLNATKLRMLASIVLWVRVRDLGCSGAFFRLIHWRAGRIFCWSYSNLYCSCAFRGLQAGVHRASMISLRYRSWGFHWSFWWPALSIRIDGHWKVPGSRAAGARADECSYWSYDLTDSKSCLWAGDLRRA